MMDPAGKYFVDLCRKLFQFEEKYGYSAGRPSVRHVEMTWRMTKGQSEILIMLEYVESYSVPTIQFRPPNRNQVFGLHEAVCALDPKHYAQQPPTSYSMNRQQLAALLEHWAEFVHAHQSELFDDQSQTYQQIKNFRKTKPDPYP
jgi:hypothetical protein